MTAKVLVLLVCLPLLGSAQPLISAVVNGASYAETLAPGCWMVIFGTELSGSTLSATAKPLPKTLGGTSVTVDGHPTALLYVSPTQINALVPYEVQTSAFNKVNVNVTTGSGTASFCVSINRNAPALFTVNAAGTGRAHVFDGLFRPVDILSENQVVIFYATGLGITDPPGSSDTGASVASRVLDNVEVFVGDQQAEVLFAGLAPGFPGIYQLNVRVPKLWTDRLYLRQRGWLSNVVQIGRLSQSNADNIVASIAPVSPSGTSAVWSSFPLLAARYDVQLNVRAGARPFVVAAVAEGGGAFTLIDPANGISETYWTSPTTAPARGDFSALLPSLTVLDFTQDCHPFPGNVIPANRLDPAMLNFLTYDLPPPSVSFPQYAAGTSVWSRPLQPGGRFVASGAFGDFFQIPCGRLKSGKTTFAVYVDGQVVASQEISFQYPGR